MYLCFISFKNRNRNNEGSEEHINVNMSLNFDIVTKCHFHSRPHRRRLIKEAMDYSKTHTDVDEVDNRNVAISMQAENIMIDMRSYVHSIEVCYVDLVE